MDYLRKGCEFSGKFNGGLREGLPGAPRLNFRLYDIKDLFTNVPNRQLRIDIEATTGSVRQRQPTWNHF